MNEYLFENVRCPNCGSWQTRCVGTHQSYEVVEGEMECDECNNAWDSYRNI